MNFLLKDLSHHYNIKCLGVSNVNGAYKIAYGISCKVKYNSIFISGAKKYARHTPEEDIGKRLCQNLVNSFMSIEDFPYKFISGMGMSIGHFICGTVKQKCAGKNVNRFLQMEPFPFTSKEDNEQHRECMIKKAGIFIFIFGDLDDNLQTIKDSGMWIEYTLAKSNQDNIIIPLPCGVDSISSKIYDAELTDSTSFSYRYKNLLQNFDYKIANEQFFNELVQKVILATREKLDTIIEKILNELNNKC